MPVNGTLGSVTVETGHAMDRRHPPVIMSYMLEDEHEECALGELMAEKEGKAVRVFGAQTVNAEVIGDVNGTNKAFVVAFGESVLPCTVKIDYEDESGVKSIVDDGEGSFTDAVGTIDYAKGVTALTLATAPKNGTEVTANAVSMNSVIGVLDQPVTKEDGYANIGVHGTVGSDVILVNGNLANATVARLLKKACGIFVL